MCHCPALQPTVGALEGGGHSQCSHWFSSALRRYCGGCSICSHAGCSGTWPNDSYELQHLLNRFPACLAWELACSHDSPWFVCPRGKASPDQVRQLPLVLPEVVPFRAVLSRPWDWDRGNADTRPELTRADYKESLIVFCIVTMQKEKESPSQPPQNIFSRAGLEVGGRRFWWLGCTEPALYQHGCRTQVDISLCRYVDIRTCGPAILRLLPFYLLHLLLSYFFPIHIPSTLPRRVTHKPGQLFTSPFLFPA